MSRGPLLSIWGPGKRAGRDHPAGDGDLFGDRLANALRPRPFRTFFPIRSETGKFIWPVSLSTLADQVGACAMALTNPCPDPYAPAVSRSRSPDDRQMDDLMREQMVCTDSNTPCSS